MKQSNTFTSGFSKDKPKIIVSLEYAWEKVKNTILFLYQSA